MDSKMHSDEYIDIEKYWLVLRRQWIPAIMTFAGVVAGSALWLSTLPEIYRSQATLLIRVNRSAQLTGLNNVTGRVERLGSDSNPLETEAQILQSRPIMQKVREKLHPLNFSQGDFEVKTVVGTDLLKITYIDENPEAAALAVNEAIEFYIEDHTFNNRSETASARAFIDEKLPQVAANLKEAEANLRDFKNKNSIADLEQETAISITSLSNLIDRINATEVQLEDINARYELLQNQLNMNWKEAAAVSALSQSVAVQSVLTQLQKVKIMLVREQNYLSNNAPQIIALKEQETDLTALLNSQIAQTLDGEQQALIKNVNILSLGTLKQEQISRFANLGLQKEGLEKQLRAYKNTYISYKQQSSNLPKLEEQQRELERRVEAADSTYQTLLSRLQETQIAEQQNIGNVRIISKAEVPRSPVDQNKSLLMFGASVLGMLLSIAVAFLFDMKDRTIKNTHEVEEIFLYPLKGIIPDFNKVTNNKQLLLSDKSVSNGSNRRMVDFMSLLPLREAYQDVQVSLESTNIKQKNKVIAVTSAVSNEGKSSVSANLAIAEAQCNRRVLLIDGDLRSPVQHSFWQISHHLGLSHVLKEEIEWRQAIQNVKQNLDILTAGSAIKHPFNLLNSSRMNALVAELIDYYDLIIIDTPPLVGLADAKIICKLASGLLFVVRPGVTTYSSAKAAKKLLESKDLNVLGIIANGVNINKEPSGYCHPDKKYLEAE